MTKGAVHWGGICAEQVQSTRTGLSSGDFDRCMWSVVTCPTGNPLYTLNQLPAAGGEWNYRSTLASPTRRVRLPSRRSIRARA